MGTKAGNKNNPKEDRHVSSNKVTIEELVLIGCFMLLCNGIQVAHAQNLALQAVISN